MMAASVTAIKGISAPMFHRWGAFVYRFRRPVAILAIILAVASMTLASRTADVLSSGGWLDATSESTTVADRLDAEFGAVAARNRLFRSSIH